MARTPFKLKSGNTTPFKQMSSSPVKQETEYTVSGKSTGPSGHYSGGSYKGKHYEKGWYTDGMNLKYMEPAEGQNPYSSKTRDVFLGGKKGKGVSSKEGDVEVRTTPHEFGTKTQRISGDVKTITMETKDPDWVKEGLEYLPGPHPWSGKSTTTTYRRNPDATGIKDQWIQE
jgi:hypothetical protein